MDNETVYNYGSAVKSLENNVISGKLVIFSSENDPDLAGDYFTKDTDFGFEGSIKSHVWLHHRKPLKTKDGKEVIKKEKIGEATLTKTDDAVLVEAILYNHKQYKEALDAMGWSSGTAGHLVERERKGNANFVKQWFLGFDASLTPIPCEPRTSPSIKSIDDINTQYQSDFIIVDNTLKAVARTEQPDIKSDPLEAIIEPNLRDGLRFEQRLDLVLAANERVITDAKEIHEMRQAQKAGRKISQSRMTKLKEMATQLSALIAEVEGADEAPTAEKSVDESTILSLVANFEQTKMARFKRV